MVVKVDLEKAYDRINWNFLKHTLHLAGFPNELIKLIMSCVEAEGFSGGIWLFWDAQELHLEVITYNKINRPLMLLFVVIRGRNGFCLLFMHLRMMN